MKLKNTRIVLDTTFSCGECCAEILKCEACNTIFEYDDSIYCLDEHHFCSQDCACTLAIETTVEKES